MKKELRIIVVLLTIASGQSWVCGQEVQRPAPLGGVAPTTQAAAKPSEMAVKDGLGVVIQLAKQEFTPDEPLVLKVTHQNASAEPMRLLDVGGQLNFWRFALEDAAGKKFTGHTTILEGPDPVENGVQSVLLKPGESVTRKLTIRRIYFVEGDLDLPQFRAAMDQAHQAGLRPRSRGQGGSPPPPNDPPLPVGMYKLSVEMSFERSPHLISVRPDVAAAKAAIEADPLLWKSGPLVSKQFEVTIKRDAPPLGLSGEDRQNARDVLALIRGWRQSQAEFLLQHAAMLTTLDRLEAAATATAEDDGKDAAAGVTRLAEFSSKLRGAVFGSRAVSRAATETEPAKNTAAQMNQRLLEMWHK